MKRLSIGISACCALIGSAAILLSGVTSSSEAIAEWEPLNRQVDQVLGDKVTAGGKAGIPNQTKAQNQTNQDKATEAVVAEVQTQVAVVDKQTDSVAEPTKPASTPAKSEVSTEASEDTANVQKVNVNTAQVTQLMNIPGIGEKKAQAIIDYRTQHGPFRQVSDLDKVKGIGPKLLEKMKPYVQL